MLLSELKDLIRRHAAELLKSKGVDIAIPPFDLSAPPPKVGGDLAANLPLMIAKQAKQSPRRLAEELVGSLPKSDLVSRAEVAGPGFVNLWVTDAGFKTELEDLLAGRRDTPADPQTSGRWLIEFVSANPTGPLHIGHGRGAALGDSLVRIFRHLGRDVTAEFYVNDAGGQIRNLGLSMEARIRELKGEPSEFPEDGYRGDYVIDLAKRAMASETPPRSIESGQMVFEENDLAGFASRRILKVIQDDLAGFGVSFDSWYRESDLHRSRRVETLLDELRNKDLVYDQDGALWFRASDFGDDKDRVLKKASEAPTYFASDIAYHDDKFERGYQRLVNVWGADHHGYAQRLRGAMTALGRDPNDLMIVLNQMVSVKGGRLSKRAGNSIALRELIEEVGKDAARFFFALRSPGAHFEFDLDLAKKQASDNPVFYVQYVHARCRSIVREAEKRNLRTEPLAWKSGGADRTLEPVERLVIRQLMDMQRVIEMCARDLSNHHLTIYLMELAGIYHSFYERCRVLDEDPAVRSFRLDLIEAIRRGVADGLALLGVDAPDRL